ncbi:MAG: hypothetical protein PHW47_11840 [Lachnospira sp.]|nr:hypothetical protein [Lachnospira sp.]
MKSYFRSRHFQAYHNVRKIWNQYRYMIFYILGMIIGFILIIILWNHTTSESTVSSLQMSQSQIFDTSYRNMLLNGKIDHLKLWKSVLLVRFREFAIFMILGFARFYEVWICMYISLEGILLGFLMGMSYAGLKMQGLLLATGTLMPHFIIYIATVILMIKFFHKREYHLKNTVAIIGLLFMIVLAGTFLEAFVNPYVQRLILYQIRNII